MMPFSAAIQITFSSFTTSALTFNSIIIGHNRTPYNYLFPTQENINCSGKGEIKLYKYTDSTNCGETCDFYFKNFVIQDEKGNEFLNVDETEDTGNKVTVYFSTVEQLDEVIPVNIHTGRSITISFEVWDEDSGNDDYERTMSGLVVPFSGIRSGGTWELKSFISNTNAEGDDKEATLKIKYRILRCDSNFAGLGCNSCVANYYGTECSKHCERVSGYYTCGSLGEKVCEERRTGDNCDTCITGFREESCQSCSDNYYPEGTCNVHCLSTQNYICSDQGEKECLENRTGSDCEDCVANQYGEDCSKTCQGTSSFSCDESGEKDCKENFYPPQKCDTRCVPVTGNYTCNKTTGDKICAEEKEGDDCDECQNRNKEGPNCDRCIKNYYADCTRYCKPADNEHYNCSDNGIKLCVDNTTLPEHNCRGPNQNLNIPLIGATGGGIGLFLILLLTCIILKVRKDRNKDVAEEILIGGETDNTQRNQYQEAIHPTVNNQAAHSSEETGDVYSRINRQEQANRKQLTQIGPDQNQDALYSTIQSQPVYATVDKGDKYARLDRHEETSNGTYSPETGEEQTYADVSFVRNGRGDDVVTFRNAAQNRDNGTGQDGAEATYITVSQVIEERL